MEASKRQPLSLEEMIAKKEEETKAQSKVRKSGRGTSCGLGRSSRIIKGEQGCNKMMAQNGQGD